MPHSGDAADALAGQRVSMLRGRPLLVVLLAFLAGAAALPAGATAGNVSISAQAFDTTGGYGNDVAWDTVDPLLIGRTGRVTYTVTNSGGAAAAVTVTLTGTDAGQTRFRPMLTAVSESSFSCGWPGNLVDSLDAACTHTVGAGQTWTFSLYVTAYAPGALLTEAAISTSDANDDLTDDAVSLALGTQCSVVGTPGDDVLTVPDGESGCGLGGDDTITGYGDSEVYSGDGDDTILAGRGSEIRFSGGNGSDTLSLANARSSVHICAAEGRWGSGGNGSTGGGGSWGYGVERVIGSAYADVIRGDRFSDTILGGGGADLIKPGGGSDTVLGGPGGDAIVADDGIHDTIAGGDGTDRVNADHADAVTSANRTLTDIFFELSCSG